MPTAMARSPGRDFSVRPRTLSTVRTPSVRQNKKNAIQAEMMASLRAERSLVPHALAPTLNVLNLLNLGPAEQARREEDQHDGEHREGGHVLVLRAVRRIGGPEGL